MSSKEEQDCVLVVQSCENHRLIAQQEEIAQTLKELVADVRDLQQQIRSGNAKKAEVATALSDLRYWLKAARETEVELEAVKRKSNGIVRAYGLDLENAQREIGSRLDRIATRGDPK